LDEFYRAIYDQGIVKQLLLPIALGIGAARHLIWYVSYQVNGRPR
jgi:hypothetical protein